MPTYIYIYIMDRITLTFRVLSLLDRGVRTLHIYIYMQKNHNPKPYSVVCIHFREEGTNPPAPRNILSAGSARSREAQEKAPTPLPPEIFYLLVLQGAVKARKA